MYWRLQCFAAETWHLWSNLQTATDNTLNRPCWLCDPPLISSYFSHFSRCKVHLCLGLIYQHVMKTHGKWSCSSTILNLGVRERWVFIFTPLLLSPRGKIPRYPLNTRMGGFQSRSWRCGDETILLSLPVIEPRFLGQQTRSLVATAIKLHLLPSLGVYLTAIFLRFSMIN
jgi:hypothetical protein